MHADKSRYRVWSILLEGSYDFLEVSLFFFDHFFNVSSSHQELEQPAIGNAAIRTRDLSSPRRAASN